MGLISALTNLPVGDDGALHVVDDAESGLVVVTFQPQHLAAAAFPQNETQNEAVAPLPVRSVPSVPSRLAFVVTKERHRRAVRAGA